MSDDLDKKVISIFSKHKTEKSIEEDKNVIKCKDGIYCVCTKVDENGRAFDSEEIVKRAREYDYIVKVLEETDSSPHIYSYKVPYSKLLNFLEGFILKKRHGKIIEIEKYNPIELA